MNRLVVVVIVASLVMGCATPPEKVSPSYVSPLEYANYSCDQIIGELRRVNRRLVEVTGAQQSEADKDGAAMAVGMILFWPALFFLIGDDKKVELARLKGEYEALEKAAIEKNCDIADELRDAKNQREEYERHKREEQEQKRKGSQSGGGAWLP